MPSSAEVKFFQDAFGLIDECYDLEWSCSYAELLRIRKNGKINWGKISDKFLPEHPDPSSLQYISAVRQIADLLSNLLENDDCYIQRRLALIVTAAYEVYLIRNQDVETRKSGTRGYNGHVAARNAWAEALETLPNGLHIPPEPMMAEPRETETLNQIVVVSSENQNVDQCLTSAVTKSTPLETREPLQNVPPIPLEDTIMAVPETLNQIVVVPNGNQNIDQRPTLAVNKFKPSETPETLQYVPPIPLKLKPETLNQIVVVSSGNQNVDQCLTSAVTKSTPSETREPLQNVPPIPLEDTIMAVPETLNQIDVVPNGNQNIDERPTLAVTKSTPSETREPLQNVPPIPLEDTIMAVPETLNQIIAVPNGNQNIYQRTTSFVATQKNKLTPGRAICAIVIAIILVLLIHFGFR